ncbi:Uncharacterised protein [uncultured archaeon]|nr:Uncharacterised protein [uncultured archaeon]
MGETRAGKYGRNLAIWINYTFQTIPQDHRKGYRTRFISELRKYSLKPRAEGEPSNEGCVHELSDLVDIEILNPEHFARLVKEGIHLMYQKQTSARVLKALEENL